MDTEHGQKYAGIIIFKICVSGGVSLLGGGITGMRIDRATGVVRDIVR